jgi:hypothetical protein
MWSLILVSLLSGCSPVKTKAYFFNPLNGAVPLYRPSVTNADSLKSAIDLSGTLLIGAANEDNRDKLLSFNTGISRSHAFQHFGFRYGLNLQAGNYKIGKVDPESGGLTVDAEYINAHAKGYFFGSYGTDGAVHFVVQGKNVEFRVIGFEWSLNKDFGDYYSFRKSTPQLAVTMRDTNNFYGTLGGFSEVIMKPGLGQLAIRCGLGHAIGNYKDFVHPELPEPYNEPLRFTYFTTTIAYSKGPYSFFVQQVGCERGSSGNIGGSLRLNAFKKLRRPGK